MARYDKYDPISGGFRALLAAPLTLDASGGFFGAVSLNAQGNVVAGNGGQSGIVGVMVKNAAKGPVGRWTESITGGIPNPYAFIGTQAGDAVDVMTAGEIVDLSESAFPAGSKVYAAADGTLSTTAGAGKVQVGFTVRAGRLVVRFAVDTTPAV